jgi:hypothetical protein
MKHFIPLIWAALTFPFATTCALDVSTVASTNLGAGSSKIASDFEIKIEDALSNGMAISSLAASNEGYTVFLQSIGEGMEGSRGWILREKLPRFMDDVREYVGRGYEITSLSGDGDSYLASLRKVARAMFYAQEVSVHRDSDQAWNFISSRWTAGLRVIRLGLASAGSELFVAMGRLKVGAYPVLDQVFKGSSETSLDAGIRAGWKSGFRLMQIVELNGEPIVWMQKGTARSSQVFQSFKNWNEAKEFIKNSWEEGYIITDCCRGERKIWIVATKDENSEFAAQEVFTSKMTIK